MFLINRIIKIVLILLVIGLSNFAFSGNSQTGFAGAGSYDVIIANKENMSQNSTFIYNLELFPGQSYTGWWYYWSNSGSLDANLQESPGRSWLSVSPTTFTSTGCNDIKAVQFSFTAPSTPGFYSTAIQDLNGNWQDVDVHLSVTNAPSANDNLFFDLILGQTITARIDTQSWVGFGNMGCISNYVPSLSIAVSLTQHPPVSWLTIQPSSYTVNLNGSQIVDAIITGDSVGSSFTYLLEEKDWFTWPKFYRIDLSTVGDLNIISPVENEVLGILTDFNILWASTGIDSLRIEFSTDNGANYSLIDAGVAADSNIYTWTVPDTPSDSCLLKLTDVTNSDVFSTKRFRIGDALILTNPVNGVRLLAGEPDTIRWEANGVDTVIISFSANVSDSGGTFSTIDPGWSADGGFYIWTVPDTLSRHCMIMLEDASTPSIYAESDTFSIKPYILTRINAQGDYEPFSIAQDAWSFANDSTSMWPESWWQEFDYATATDRFTDVGYPQYFPTWPFYAVREDFPDWELLVDAFGINQCYWDVTEAKYSLNALFFWRNLKGEWLGSCFGFALTSLIAFGDRSGFHNIFPFIPSFGELRSLSAEEEERKAINRLFLGQYGVGYRARWKAKRLQPPSEMLMELRQMLLSDVRNDQFLILISNDPTDPGAHAVVPYKIEAHETLPDRYWIYVYDNNAPNDFTLRFLVNTNTEIWSYSRYPNWGGFRGLFLSNPMSEYYSDFQIPKDGPEAGQNPFLAGSGLIDLYHSAGHDVEISNTAGQRAGFVDSVMVEEIPDALPLIPITGYYHEPIGFELPVEKYRVTLSNHTDSTTYLSAVLDSVIYHYGRSDAAVGEQDRVTVDNSLSIVNPDAQIRTINLQTIRVKESSERLVDITNLEMNQNDSLRSVFIESGDYSLANFGVETRYDLRMEEVSATGNPLFEHSDISIPANSSQQISPVWEDLDNQPVQILIDIDNNGTIDDSLLIFNEVSINNMNTGWNLIGLPRAPGNAHYLSLFPTAVENTLFGFNGSYIQEDTLKTGNGYWLRFPADSIVSIRGSYIDSLTIHLSEGWNLISGTSCDIPLNSLSDPDSIIINGTLFGFDGSYILSDTIREGSGYWIRASDSGQVNLTCNAPASLQLAKHSSHLLDLGTFPSLSISNSSGASQTLFFNVELENNKTRLSYSMPPLPPAGAFDARFDGDFRISGADEAVIRVQSLSFPLTISAANLAQVKTNQYAIEVEGKIYPLREEAPIKISNQNVKSLKLTKTQSIPLSFQVSQNYPNPFNPETIIKYAIPGEEKVEITIYNTLGQKIKTLVDEVQKAGFYQVKWNATNNSGHKVGSGVFFYVVRAGEFRSVKKMVLLK